MEYGEIERPFKPVIRIVTPVVNGIGEKAGVIVINLRAASMLEALDKTSNAINGRLGLVNQDGFWLYGVAPKKLWGFMFQDKLDYTFSRENPVVWKKIQIGQRGTIQTTEGIHIFESVKYDESHLFQKTEDTQVQDEDELHRPTWKLISFIPASVASDGLQKIRLLFISLFLFIAVFGGIGAITLVRTLLKSQEAKREILRLAHYDPLTNLANRSLFNENLTLELAHALRLQEPLVLMYMDLDRFKPINDELGHEAGDEVLKQASDRLKTCLRESDTLARLGGDEFAAILPHPGTQGDMAKIAERIIECFSKPFSPMGHKREVGISIGIAIFTRFENSTDELIRHSDKAMYQAKKAGRNCYRFHKADMTF